MDRDGHKAGDQQRMPLIDAIEEYQNRKPAYFCIPGHRFERGVNERWRRAMGDGVFRFDLTETPLTDDLHNATGAILEAETLAAQLFGAEESHFLINGTTCGNQVMVLSAAFSGQKIAIPRNAHKSVLMGLIMGGAQPVYLMPEILPGWGLHGGITPEAVEKLFLEHPDCRGVLAVSPTYFGLCSDLRAIASICHRHNAMLLVDEAHGAHCYVSDRLPEGALSQGADMCAQSIHKVAGALTQSSMLHIGSSRPDLARVRANLHLVQSTSPSYLLMASLDAARQDLALRGEELADVALELADYARKEMQKIDGISCLGTEILGQAAIKALDRTRLTFSGWELGLTGFELKDLLFEQYGCDTELADYKNVLAIVTFGNTKEDIDRLLEGLRGISAQYMTMADRQQKRRDLERIPQLPAQPEYVASPRDSYFAQKKRVPWEQAKESVSGEMIAPYPPGIPAVYPGERISSQVWNFLEQYRKEARHFHGPSDPTLNTVLILE